MSCCNFETLIISVNESPGREMDTVNTYAIDYWSPKTNSESQRYTVHIIDSEKDKLSQYSGKYGVFIVPIGKYMYIHYIYT